MTITMSDSGPRPGSKLQRALNSAKIKCLLPPRAFLPIAFEAGIFVVESQLCCAALADVERPQTRRYIGRPGPAANPPLDRDTLACAENADDKI